MEVTMRVNGMSSSGNRYDTNDVTVGFTVLPGTFVEPTDGVETPGATADPESGAAGEESGFDGDGDVSDLELAF
jgi:hypothetical protein